MANLVSLTIFLLLLYGLRIRHRGRRRHIQIMLLVIVADTTLVLYLTVFSRVLGKAVDQFSPLLGVHIFFAIATLVLYYYAAVVGLRLAKGNESMRPRMRWLGGLIAVTRGATLATSSLLVFLK